MEVGVEKARVGWPEKVAVAIALTVELALIAALAVGAWPDDEALKNHQQLAAWVQAVGSVVAILASVGLVLLQQRFARADKRRERDAHDFTRIEGARRLAMAGRKVAEKISAFLVLPLGQASAADRALMTGELAGIAHGLKTIAAHEFADWTATEASISSLGAVEGVERMLGAFVEDDLDRNAPLRRAIQVRIANAAQDLAERELVLAKYLWLSHPKAASAVIRNPFKAADNEQ